MPKLACVTVNLLGLPHLCRHVGVDERSLPPAGVSAVSRRAPERFGELLDRKSVPATFFVVGDDLDDGPSAMSVAELARLGHELATHGTSGDPDLAQRRADAIREDVRRACDAIERLQGRRPVGFRLPGGCISGTLLASLEDEHLTYDASVHPSPLRWLDAALPRGDQRRKADPAQLLAPRAPYRPSLRNPFRRGTARLIEFPAATVPVSRLPFSGRAMVSLPKSAAAALYRAVRFRDFLAVELNGWDLLDESDGASAALAARRHDLRIAAAAKRQRLSELLDWLRDDFEVLTLEEAANRLAPTLRASA